MIKLCLLLDLLHVVMNVDIVDFFRTAHVQDLGPPRRVVVLLNVVFESCHLMDVLYIIHMLREIWRLAYRAHILDVDLSVILLVSVWIAFKRVG